jgi:hypothetical protein
MYQESLEGLRRMDYYNGVQGFINYTLSNPITISKGGIKYKKGTCVGLHTINHMFLTRPW